jgi:hypothetical protein
METLAQEDGKCRGAPHVVCRPAGSGMGLKVQVSWCNNGSISTATLTHNQPLYLSAKKVILTEESRQASLDKAHLTKTYQGQRSLHPPRGPVCTGARVIRKFRIAALSFAAF